MTSLTDVYDGDVGSVVDRRRRRLGTALFLVGAAIVVAAIAMATTDLRQVFGLGLYEAREVAGLLAGLGLPGVFVGIFAVLPASRAVRAAAAIGAGFAFLGVSLFAYAYPDRWLSVDPALTVAAILLYSLGTLTTVWCLFAALATFKTRNDPGGTARMEITEEGRIRIIERAGGAEDSGGIPGFGGFGSVGLFGNDPDGSVETQTNRQTHAADGGTGVASASDGGTEVFRTGESGSDSRGTSVRGGRSPGGSGPGQPHPNATSDGGAEVLDDAVDAVDAHATPDEYCGNCTHFEYVRLDGELVPYCGFHEDLLEDMDACEDWTPNR
jgi:hypothetical protein